MKTKEMIGTFEETAEYQTRYESLLSVCDAEGTMIIQDRLLERDQDIAPYRFFRRGTKEYVFPQQDASLSEDKSCVIDSSPGYELKTEDQTFNFNQDLVKGRIRIEYEDANNRPILKLSEVFSNSKLPKNLLKLIESL